MSVPSLLLFSHKILIAGLRRLTLRVLVPSLLLQFLINALANEKPDEMQYEWSEPQTNVVYYNDPLSHVSRAQPPHFRHQFLSKSVQNVYLKYRALSVKIMGKAGIKRLLPR